MTQPRGIQLDEVVPWGRGLSEYERMFLLSEKELRSERILDVAGGPASFNSEVLALGGHVTSIDPIYDFSREEIQARIDATTPRIIELTHAHRDAYHWDMVASPEELAELRLASMRKFLVDFEDGKSEGRYLSGTLPTLDFPDESFDLALCSHLLFTYGDQFDLRFHITAIEEMLRVAAEVRVFPVINLDGSPSPHRMPIVKHFRNKGFEAREVGARYHMQKGGDNMLRIGRY